MICTHFKKDGASYVAGNAESLVEVVKASPNDKDARAKLQECDKEMKKEVRSTLL